MVKYVALKFDPYQNDGALNHFSGEIPTSLSNLKDLSCMFLHQNNLNGSLPESFGNLTKVTQIFLKSNKFTGQIPLSLSNLEDLSFVDLSYNNFGGEIPNFLSNLTKLTEVYLSYNQLTSQIGEFQPSNSLQILRLENNQIHGAIPKSLSNLVNLIELDISSNNLSGIVEFNTSTELKKLRDLDLSFNSLLLSIKSKFNCTFPALKYVNLVSCNITEFPNFLISSEKLEYLDLSNNRIYGRIPNWMSEDC
ncbi:receptor-like protein 33 [Quercus suber]|uniref:Receptor-like protein 33 n=1 Tax=Quercus suber TaxID=58331 RepID=A0AAW0JHX6_QUESU